MSRDERCRLSWPSPTGVIPLLMETTTQGFPKWCWGTIQMEGTGLPGFPAAWTEPRLEGWKSGPVLPSSISRLLLPLLGLPLRSPAPSLLPHLLSPPSAHPDSSLCSMPSLYRAARAQRLGQKLPSHQLQNLPYRTRPVPVSRICRDPNPPERCQVGSLTLAGKQAHSDPGCWHMDFKLARPHLTASPWPTPTSRLGV